MKRFVQAVALTFLLWSLSYSQQRFDLSVIPRLIETHCVSCHNPQARQGSLTLAGADPRTISDNETVLWEKVLHRLRTRTMPPGRNRPDEPAYIESITALALALDQASAQRKLSKPPRPVANDELATRIAMFLWNDKPDAALVQAATRGVLEDPAGLKRQVQRMMKDPRSEGLIQGFVNKWLLVSTIDLVRRPPNVRPFWTEAQRRAALDKYEQGQKLFPEFDEALRTSMDREIELFVDSQMRNDRPVTELWTANYTFLNERLARHYGMPDVVGPAFRRVTLPGDNRTGLLGKAGISLVTSLLDRTSPVLRSKWVSRVFFNQLVPAPPPDLKPLDPGGKPVRKAMEEYLAQPRCASCHAMYDPLGFALENYDALGRWRTIDAGSPIDSSGRLFDGTSFSNLKEFREGLLKSQDIFVDVMTGKLLSYAMGRASGRDDIPNVEAFDQPAVRSIVRAAKTSGYRWSALIVGVIKSAPFQESR